MIEIILQIISTIIETLTMVFFGQLFLKKRDHSPAINILIIIVVTALDFMTDFVDIPYYFAIIYGSAEFFIILFIIYKITPLNTLFFTWIYGVIMEIADIIIACILTYVFESGYGIISAEKTAYYIGMFLSDAVVFAFLYFVVYLAKKKLKKLPKKYSIIIILYPAFCFLLIKVIDTMMIEANYNNPLFILIPVFCLMYIIFMVFDFFDGYSQKIEYESLKKITREREANYRTLKESNEQIRIMRHDMNKHLKVITDLISKDKTDEARKYIEALNDENKNFSSYIYTNNEAFDTAVNIECQRAKASGVDFKSFIGVNGEIKMDDTDITKLFCNLLDNAVEAAEKTKEKFVSIYVTQKGGDLAVSVKNSSGEVDVSDLKTTKSDEDNHGYGLKSIDSVLEKYDSSIYQSYQGGVFETDIVLKNCCT